MEEVDDSSGQMGLILQELHLKACRRAKPASRGSVPHWTV
jgi:hypothetical protein